MSITSFLTEERRSSSGTRPTGRRFAIAITVSKPEMKIRIRSTGIENPSIWRSFRDEASFFMSRVPGKERSMICRYCGCEFEPKKRGRKNTGFCCKHCADNWRRHNVYDLQPKKYRAVCEHCGVAFETNNKDQRYCSRRCSARKRCGTSFATSTFWRKTV